MRTLDAACIPFCSPPQLDVWFQLPADKQLFFCAEAVRPADACNSSTLLPPVRNGSYPDAFAAIVQRGDCSFSQKVHAPILSFPAVVSSLHLCLHVTERPALKTKSRGISFRSQGASHDFEDLLLDTNSPSAICVIPRSISHLHVSESFPIAGGLSIAEVPWVCSSVDVCRR